MARSVANIPKPKGSALKGTHGVNHTGQPSGHKAGMPKSKSSAPGSFKRGKSGLCK